MIIKKSYNHGMSVKIATAVACTVGGAGCAAGMAAEGLRYSSWGDPGAMTVCVALFWSALALLSVPAVMTAAWLARELRRDLRRLGLTPGQAALLQAGAMEAAHHEWSRYNREWSARLTESVMGPEREHQWP